MAPNEGQLLTRQLAAQVEAKCADLWEAGPQVALLRRRCDTVEAVTLRSIDEPVEASIDRLPHEPATAACVTALGHVSPSDAGGALRRRTRVTVAVTCCTGSSILRLPDGTVVRSDEVGGRLVDVLRSWADLESCSCAEAGSDRITPPRRRLTINP